MSESRRKRSSILWSYLFVAIIMAASVAAFGLLYKGGGARHLLVAEKPPAAAPTPVAPTPTPAALVDGRLFPYLEGGLWGYKNAKGESVVEPQFLTAMEFGGERHAFAATAEGYGLISRSGRFIVNPSWSSVRPFVNGFAAVEQNDKWGYINTEGKLIIPYSYREAGDFFCGRAKVRTGDFFGYVDVDGDMAIRAEWGECGDFNSDMAFASQDGKGYIIDKTGEKITTLGKVTGRAFSEGFAAVRTENGDYKYYNANRRYAFSAVYEGARNFSGHMAAIMQGGKWGFINSGGVEVVAPYYATVGDFHESRAAVQDETGKWGYIDASGSIIVPPAYDEAGDFSLGYALVKQGQKVGIVDKAGVFTLLYEA